MSSRDIWSHGSGSTLRDLLVSILGCLLLTGKDSHPVYFSSPWMSDFPLFPNHYGEFAALFPDLSEQAEIRYSQFLVCLSKFRQVRIITVRNTTSNTFFRNPIWEEHHQVEVRFAPETYHEKGILAPNFYIEGSMNLTFSGVYIRDEKISFYAVPAIDERITRAYLEFDRLWGSLSSC